MRVFLTSNDLLDIPQPIECNVIRGGGWGNSGKLVVEVVRPFTLSRFGHCKEVSRLLLCPVKSAHQIAPFFENHAWVDVFLPSEFVKEMRGRICVGLVHRTRIAAQGYLPPQAGLAGQTEDAAAVSIEEAAMEHIRKKSSLSLQSLYGSILSGNLLVPLFDDLTKDAAGQTDVPVRCIRLDSGEGCVPVFTSVRRLLEWKREGSKYTEMSGRALFKMVTSMPEVDCVVVNYSDVRGTPKGKIMRREFESLARCVISEDTNPAG